MQYLFPSRNLLNEATGYSVNGGSVNTRVAVSKTGGGMVSMGVAREDAEIDVEIVNNTITGTPTVSTPTFAGVGNCTMTAVTATSAVAAQVFTVTLADLGTDSRKAFAPFQGVFLRAKSTGSGGNSITVEVDESGITRTGTDSSLLSPLVEGQNEYVGDEWNFGAPVLNPDGTIPTSAPRISFGDDPQVYRQYREFVDGRYVYRFSPVPVRNVGVGARVKAVTGSRVVTMTNGVTTRTYTNVTTLYSLLTAVVADASALVDVDGVVAVDTTQGGMGITEMSVRTVSYLQSLERDGTPFVQSANLTIGVAEDAPTELLTIRCKDTNLAGAEIWEVSGTVAGEMQDAVTGVAYADGDYTFTIPQQLAPGVSPAAFKSVRLDLRDRGEGQAIPTLCVENFVLGADAQQRTYTYTWTTRRPECDCDDVDIDGGPNGDHLGIDPPEGAEMADLIPAALLARIQTLYAWKSTFVSANTSILAGSTAVTGDSISPSVTSQVPVVATESPAAAFYSRVGAVLKVDRVDIEAANKAVDIFVAALNEVYESLGDDPIPGAATTDFDAAVTDMQTEFANLSTLIGSDNWRTWATYVAGVSDATTPEWLAANASRLLTQEFETYLERYRARMAKFYTLAGVQPPFDGTTLKGNSVWSDRGGTAWFESQEGLLPIQPGYYYHSARLDDDGEPVSTREFGIGVGIACGESLQNGDKLIITISPQGNIRVTYQVGDRFTARIINGAPIQLGGGQTGNDTQTWRVRGSVAGALADYSLNKTTPNAYSAGNIGFLITPGGIANALGDAFEFYVEGGQFRYRVNGDSWSSNLQIAGTVNTGLWQFRFANGAAPSFVPGDTYSFKIVALNSQARLLSPVFSRILVDSNALFLPYGPPFEDGSAKTVLFVRNPIAEQIPVWLTILDVDENVVENHIFQAQPGDNAWDVTDLLVNGSGDGATLRVGMYEPDTLVNYLDWVWLGEPFEFEMSNAVIEHGEANRRIRLGQSARPTRRIGTTVRHTAVDDDSLDEFLELLNDAHVNHDGRFGVVFNGGKREECGIVRIAGEAEVEIEDVFQHQPNDPSARLNALTLNLEPIP